MKKSTFQNIFLYLAAAVLFVTACKKDEQTKLAPAVATSATVNITDVTAVVSGFIVASGSGFTERGVCWSTTHTPTIANSKYAVPATETKASFEGKLTGLTRQTTYYVRAYATGTDGVTIYGEEFTVVTTASLPALTSIEPVKAAEQVTTDKGIVEVSGGNISDMGGVGISIAERGVVISTKTAPTVSDDKRVSTQAANSFAVTVDNLKGNTTYYIRAYAKNSIGVAYGNEFTFTTPTAFPIVTTAAVEAASITKTSAVVTGSYIEGGVGNTVTVKGICWSTSSAPTVNDSKIVDGGSTGSIKAELSGLTENTTYYVRAYATNSVGTNYGKEISFKTLGLPTALYMIGDGVSSLSGNDAWSWSLNDLPMVPVNSHPNLFWKIVWLNGTGGFKFAPGKAWVNDFGKTGDATDGVYAKGGDNIPVPGTAGYYMVVVDLQAGKIAIADPKVYLMGSTVGGWDTANPNALMTVDNANKVIKTTKTLTAGEIRMYAWHPWFTDWWQSEFIVLNNKIELRGTGGDQARVSVTSGDHTVSLNFVTGDGSIQ